MPKQSYIPRIGSNDIPSTPQSVIHHRKKAKKNKVQAPLLVISLEDAFFGDAKRTCIFCALRLQASLVDSMYALSQLSTATGNEKYTGPNELLVGHWPMIWDGTGEAGITKSVWHVRGNSQWASCYSSTGALLGRTIDFDVRELAIIFDSAEATPLVWHCNDGDDWELQEYLGKSFEELALERLKKCKFVPESLNTPPSYRDLRQMLLELDYQPRLKKESSCKIKSSAGY